MSDLASLGLVIAALALAESVWWVRHGAVVLKVPFFWGQGALATLSGALGNERGALTFLNPLPPFGRAYVVEPWPFSASEQGVVGARSFSFQREPRPAGTPRALTWDALETLASDDATLLANGAPLAQCASRHHAAAALAVLHALHGAKPRDRARVLDEQLEAHLDPDAVRARTGRHRALGSAAVMASLGLFVALFGAIPFEVAQRGLQRWPWLLGLLYAWVALAAVSTSLVQRGLYGGPEGLPGSARAERVGQLVLMFLAPYTALRANDKVGRNLLAGLHPIAAALALASPTRGHAPVLCALRDLSTPRPLALDEAGAAIEADFRARLLRAAKKRAEGRGVDVAALARPPALGPRQAAYCPRCLTPYRPASGTCGDCGVPLATSA